MSAVLGLVYSVETGNWDYAFESLNASSQEHAESPLRLWVAVDLLNRKDPDFGIPIREIIVEAIRRRRLEFQDDERDVAKVNLLYIGRDQDGVLSSIKIPVYVERESVSAADPGTKEWRVDIVSSLTQLYGGQQGP